MLVSHKWLVELLEFDVAVDDVAKQLTSGGLEVEHVRRWGENLTGIVIAEVRGKKPHPSRDKLSLVTLFDGVAEQEVVCGASNVPDAGGLVAFARLGSTLPGGLKIEERKLGGVVSRGMICSEKELDIGADEDGILVIEKSRHTQPGAALADALDLRDTVYTLGLTPNRPDCLGHVGIARELCALIGDDNKAFTFPRPTSPRRLVQATSPLWQKSEHAFSLADQYGSMGAEPVKVSGIAPVSLQVSAPERCPRYGAALVTGVKIGPSAFVVRYRLHVLGQRAISNVVDATNLVLLGFGHPIHAFDLRKLRGSRIEVRLAKAGETMHTLDGQARALDADDLVICDGEGPVALAGVMGGANSEIGPGTEHVLIECAYFDPPTVRRTSKRTGLHTDSSHRFERGVDPSDVRAVLAHAAAWIADLAGGAVVPDALDFYAQPTTKAHVTFRRARAQALLGAEIDLARARAIFARLGCHVTPTAADTLAVTMPLHRPDLAREVDLIEEYARIVGYDTIATSLPNMRPSPEGTAPAIRFVRRVRESAASAGLWEAVNFAFVSPADHEKARVPASEARVANPMSEERSVLRTALLPGLLQNLVLSQRHAQKRFAGYEVARVFGANTDAKATLPSERYELGALLWGMRASSYDEREQLDFYDAKGMLESITHALAGVPVETVHDSSLDAQAPFLHPKRRGRVRVAGVDVGVLGELHPDIVNTYGLEGRPIYAALDVAALQHASEQVGVRKASPLPRFPASTRDLAVVVAEDVSAGEVASVLHDTAGTLAETVKLFDIYRGAPVPEGQKSLAFHVVYRDPRATLTDKLVDETHAKLTAIAEQRFRGTLR